jgi:hypothetical protein
MLDSNRMVKTCGLAGVVLLAEVLEQSARFGAADGVKTTANDYASKDLACRFRLD